MHIWSKLGQNKPFIWPTYLSPNQGIFICKRTVVADCLFLCSTCFKLGVSLQCFPEGTDMTSVLDFYFQVSVAMIFFVFIIFLSLSIFTSYLLLMSDYCVTAFPTLLILTVSSFCFLAIFSYISFFLPNSLYKYILHYRFSFSSCSCSSSSFISSTASFFGISIVLCENRAHRTVLHP